MLLTKQSSGNYQKEGIHGVLQLFLKKSGSDLSLVRMYSNGQTRQPIYSKLLKTNLIGLSDYAIKSKNIPEFINKRLSQISSDKESFEKGKGIYQDALNKSGYN